MSFRELRDVDTQVLEKLELRVNYVYDDSKWPTRPYKDGEKVGGTLTGGVGHTGADVKPWIGKTIPDATIDKWLDDDTDAAEQFISSLRVALNNHQFAALVFWSFNIGIEAARTSTLVKKLKAGDYDSVPGQLERWNKTRIDGKLVDSNGLKNRRAAEIAYWLADPSKPAPQPAERPEGKPSGTQQGQLDVPKTITPETIGMATGAVTAIGGVSNPQIGWALAGIAVVAFAVALYFFISKRIAPK